MGGLARKAPATSLATIGASLSISGIPPFNGFWSKLMIIVALLRRRYYAVAGVAGLTALMTLMSFIKVQRKALFGPLPERLADGEGSAACRCPCRCSALSALCLVTAILWPLGLKGAAGPGGGRPARGDVGR